MSLSREVVPWGLKEVLTRATSALGAYDHPHRQAERRRVVERVSNTDITLDGHLHLGPAIKHAGAPALQHAWKCTEAIAPSANYLRRVRVAAFVLQLSLR